LSASAAYLHRFKQPKESSGLAAVAYDWSVEVDTTALCSALCKGNSLETAVRYVTVQYEEDWDIFIWSDIVFEMLEPAKQNISA
jgi:hypothetical protein